MRSRLRYGYVVDGAQYERENDGIDGARGQRVEPAVVRHAQFDRRRGIRGTAARASGHGGIGLEGEHVRRAIVMHEVGAGSRADFDDASRKRTQQAFAQRTENRTLGLREDPVVERAVHTNVFGSATRGRNREFATLRSPFARERIIVYIFAPPRLWNVVFDTSTRPRAFGAVR